MVNNPLATPVALAASWVLPAKLSKSARSWHGICKLRFGSKSVLQFALPVIRQIIRKVTSEAQGLDKFDFVVLYATSV
jgi:hypothetical protein